MDCMHKIIERTFYGVWGQCEFPVSGTKEEEEYKIYKDERFLLLLYTEC